MTVRLRLQRCGRQKRPYYKIVAIDQKAKRDGQPIEVLGQYDPLTVDNKFNIKMDRVNYWIGVGAQASETVAVLIKKNQTMETK